MYDDLYPQADPLLKIAEENFGLSYLFPYQRLVVTNILEAASYLGLSIPHETGGGPEGSHAEPEASSRDDEDILDIPSKQLVILPTGAGKSLCFQLPALLLSRASLIIYPLISLMNDQKRRLQNAGIGCGLLSGGQTAGEREELFSRVREGDIKIIISNPETALLPRVLKQIAECKCSHFVVDEAHCICEWGESFRPVYQRLAEVYIKGEIPIVTAFTATASPRVLQRIRDLLFPESDCHLVRGNPDRPNISYRVIPSLSVNHSLSSLLKRDEGERSESSGRTKRPAIVFCRSRTGAEMAARLLRNRLCEKEIFFYHAGLRKSEKKKIENWFFTSKEGILTATCAYGMGIDKPDIRTVIHVETPPSVEAYLQESGRAGRDREAAEAVLIKGLGLLEKAAMISNSLARSRYLSLVDYTETKTCRRAFLLNLLGAHEVLCTGCDVCSLQRMEKYIGYEGILFFLSRRRRRYTATEAAAVLIGEMNYFSRKNRLNRDRYFGLMSDWVEEDLKEAIEGLIQRGIIKRSSRYLFGGRLSIRRKAGDLIA